jgi:hypothetical protein
LTFIQGSGNLRLAVKLPEGEDLNEWLAVHGELVGPFASLHQWDHHPPSRRFLQPPQHALRHGDGVLHPSGGPSSPVFRHSRNLIMDGAHRSARLCPRALGEIPYMLFIDQDVRPL